VELRQHGRPWRENEDEIVVFKSVGVGLTDLAAADLVWQAHRAAEAA
jgi:ornithine cyclodeaminase